MKDCKKELARSLGYPEDLIEPIAEDKLILKAILAKSCKDKEELVQDDFVRKLGILMDHYKIKVNSQHPWIDLVFRLTNDLIPGFAVVETPPKTRGAPTLNERGSLKLLYDEIEKIRSNAKSIPLKKACREFLKVHKREERWRDINARTVENLYREAAKEQKKLKELTAQIWANYTTTPTLHDLFGLDEKPEEAEGTRK